MKSSDSISSFFWNLVPGSIFLIALTVVRVIQAPALSDSLTIFIVVTLGFFTGNFFQALGKIVRSRSLNSKITDSLLLRRKKLISQFEGSANLLSARLSKLESLDLFHLMDHYVRSHGDPFLIDDFSRRLALWTNSAIASFLFLFICSVQIIKLLLLGISSTQCYSLTLDPTLIVVLYGFSLGLVMFAFSFYISLRYLEDYYDTILKSYIATSLGFKLGPKQKSRRSTN